MGIRKNRIKSFNIVPPSKSAFTIDTPPDIPKLHTLMLVSGKRGGGKSVATVNFVKKLQDLELLDRVLLITPTYHSNKQIWDLAEIADEDILEPELHVLKTIIGIIEAERAEWDLYLQQKELYLQFKKDVRKKRVTQIDEESLLLYQDYGFFEGPPQWKYKQEVPPRLFLIIDDCLGCKMFNPSGGLTSFIIKHRHLGKGLGISVAMLVQSYSCQGGIARPIRENCTALLLFKCKDEQQRKKIWSEVGTDVELEHFDEMYNYATSEPYNFLFVDFSPKTPEQQFRRNFEEYLVPYKMKSEVNVSAEKKVGEENVGNI